MNHVMRAVGLALLALVCVSAMGASVARANNITSASGKYPLTVTGADEQKEHGKLVRLTIGGIRFVECTANTGEATLSKEETKITVTPTYSECFTNGLTAAPATVTMNGCDYVLEATGKAAGQATVVCPSGKVIEVHVYENLTKHAGKESLCTYTIPSQGPLKGLTLKQVNAGLKRESITIEVNLAEIEVETHGPNKLTCGQEPTKAGKVASLKGSYETTGETESASEDLPFMVA